MSFLVVPLDVTPLPTFDPIRLPPTQANRGLLPPANPLPHELPDFWAEACAATLRCLMSAACNVPLMFPSLKVRAARCANAALRGRLVEVWRRVASLQNRAGAFLWELGCLRN